MSKPFDEALRQARLSEAAHLDALIQIEGSKSLRLAALRDKLFAALADRPEALEHVELRLVPGETPRLWTDLLTSVVMEPDPGTYRLERDQAQLREVLFESPNPDLVVQNVLKLEAHKALAAHRQEMAAETSDAAKHGAESAPSPAVPETGRAIRFATFAYVWITGFLFGAAALAIAAIYMEKLVF